MTKSQGVSAGPNAMYAPGSVGLRLFGAILCVLLLGAGDARSEESGAQARHINSQRLQGTLEKLSEFGRNPEGGVTRLGFSQIDLDARTYVMSLMKDAGLEIRVDPAGNIFGRRSGSDQLPLLLFGSHIDSVPHGGNFDGALGSLGAIEVIRALNDGHITTRHPLEVVIWANEEGPHFGISALGSGVAAGVLGPEILDRKDDDGLTVADWLRRYGQDPSHLTDARIAPGALAAVLELHIEQGPVLEETKVQIGVVSGIVSLKRWTCVATGFANHAGTTPMNRRRDALAAAAKDLLAVRDVVRAEPGTQVGTVGYLRAEPGAPNVISGRVEFPVELRDLDAGKIEQMWQHIQQRFAQTDKEEGVETRCEVINDIAAAPSDPSVQSVIREAARSAGLSTADMPSGAVHDAGEISRIAPMGMIFVPSQDGISHAPQEFTSWDDCANGVEVLYRSILLLDRRLQPN
jgi:beta-ureidopropionase / N-carbamoyl-L-amino-acid hydrolase